MVYISADLTFTHELHVTYSMSSAGAPYLALNAYFKYWTSNSQCVTDNDENVPAINKLQSLRPRHSFTVLNEHICGVFLIETNVYQIKNFSYSYIKINGVSIKH